MTEKKQQSKLASFGMGVVALLSVFGPLLKHTDGLWKHLDKINIGSIFRRSNRLPNLTFNDSVHGEILQYSADFYPEIAAEADFPDSLTDSLVIEPSSSTGSRAGSLPTFNGSDAITHRATTKTFFVCQTILLDGKYCFRLENDGYYHLFAKYSIDTTSTLSETTKLPIKLEHYAGLPDRSRGEYDRTKIALTCDGRVLIFEEFRYARRDEFFDFSNRTDVYFAKGDWPQFVEGQGVTVRLDRRHRFGYMSRLSLDIMIRLDEARQSSEDGDVTDSNNGLLKVTNRIGFPVGEKLPEP